MANYCKYKKEILQVSYNNGVTWSNVTPESARTGDLIEISSSDCGYVPPTPTDYSKQYLTFVPIESAMTFAFNSVSGDSISYSLDSGSTWNTLASGVSTPSVAVGQKIMWKASGLTVGNEPYSHGIGQFWSFSECLFNVEGNIMSLISGDSFSAATTIVNWQFNDLFVYDNIVSAENLILPATTMKLACYNGMFAHCTSLTTAPALPATTLAITCYANMFAHCRSLTNAPELPATTMKLACYNAMFAGCTSLTTPPVLSATTLEEGCYEFMFRECTSLTIAPELPATTLAQECYREMFYGCTNLIYIKCLATNLSAIYCTANWLYGVASSGYFVKNASMSSWTSGSDGIPTNWTVLNAT